MSVDYDSPSVDLRSDETTEPIESTIPPPPPPAAPPIPLAPPPNQSRLVPALGIALAVALVVTAIALLVRRGDQSTLDPTIDHQRELTRGETAFIARFLVDVEGYSYINDNQSSADGIRGSNEAYNETIGRELIGATTAHGVVADDESQNTAEAWNGVHEVGFLVLRQLNEAVPHGIDGSSLNGPADIEPFDELELSGITVSVWENPDMPHSRFTYLWIEHGVFGYFDGADREPMERFLEQYLATPKLDAYETIELAARLQPVPGFQYSDFDAEAVGGPLPDLGEAAWSWHHLADADGSIGTLVLTASDDPRPLTDWIERLGLREVGRAEIGEQSVTEYEGAAGRAYVWTEPGLSGAVMTNPAGDESARRFVEAFR